MINVNEIIRSTMDKNLKSFLDIDRTQPYSEEESQTRIYKALLEYSSLLLEGYHNALKVALAQHGIDI